MCPEFGDQAVELLFESASILGPSYQAGQAQFDNMLSRQVLPSRNSLGQAFHDRCLAHTGFSNQRRVVFAHPGKNLDYLQHLLAASGRARLSLMLPPVYLCDSQSLSRIGP